MNIILPSLATDQQRVVIVGGGFGGLALLKALRNSPFQVVLIDKNNYHTFQPLLYQVATGGLEADSIAYPLRKIVRKYTNLYFRMAEVETVDPETKTVFTSIGELHYDYLVIATGSQPNYFNFENIKDKLFVMKSVPQALDLRSYLLQNFEAALSALSIKHQEEKLNIVIVGGGPTGVELAGALAEMKRYILSKDYPELDFSRMHLHLFEAADRLLAGMSEAASKYAFRFLKEMGVIVHLKCGVKYYDGVTVSYGDRETIVSDNVIWTAGVKGKTIMGLEKAVISGDRYQVDSTLQLREYPAVYAIGDVAAMVTEDLPKGHPMLASVASQQAAFLAKVLLDPQKNRPAVFRYKDMGTLATIGRNKAVADLGTFRFHGAFAWFLWMSVHLMLLAGFRNRLVTLLDWAWNYVSYDRALRLIIRPFKK